MENEKKYKLTDECITFDDIKLYRIEALKDFGWVRKGDKGGFIESEDNLSQKGDCWVSDDAKVYGNARVFGDCWVYETSVVCGDAEIHGNAKIHGNCWVSGDAEIHGNAKVCDNVVVSGNAKVYNAIVCGNANVYGNAKIECSSDYIVFKNWWSSGRYFTWTRSNNMWRVGCFYGTGEELIAKAYKDNELSGREYERVVKYVESILKDSK